MPTTFNTTDPKPGYVYEVATDTWFPLLGIAPGSSIVRWRKTAVGAETSVSGLDDLSATLSYNAGTEQVYLNGVLLVRTEDYLATTGTSVTGLTALAASDVIEVIAFNATNVQITDALLETDINAKGDLIVGAAVDTAAILTSGTNGQVLSVNTATATGLEWVTSDDANAIQNAIVDAKGDIIAATAADTVSRLAVGANGTVLTAASGQATGLEWATPSSGGMTLINSGGTTLTGAAVSISSIPATFVNLFLVIRNFLPASDGQFMTLRYNNDSGANRYASYEIAAGANNQGFTTTSMRIGQTQDNAQSEAITTALIYDYANTTTWKHAFVQMIENNSTTPSNLNFLTWTSVYNQTSAINEINILCNSGNFTSGTAFLYGVK